MMSNAAHKRVIAAWNAAADHLENFGEEGDFAHQYLAGRYALAYNFFEKWRFVTDVDTDELLTWKTQEEALIIGEAWRTAWETIRLPRPEPHSVSASHRSRPS